MKFLKSTLTSAVLLLACAGSYAQQQEVVDTAVFARIRKAELNSSQIPQIAHYITDVSGGRLTGSPAYTRAANWAVATMKKWGLANAATESWGTFGKQWEIQDFSIMMRAPYPAQVRAYPNPWSESTNGLVQGEVTLITPSQAMDTTYLAAHQADFNGKFVMVVGSSPGTKANFKASAERLTDAELANLKDTYMVPPGMITMYLNYIKTFKTADVIFKKAGALAFINTGGGNMNGTVFVQGEYGYKLTDPETVPRASMAMEDAQKIKRLIASGQKVQLSLNISGKFSTDDTNGYNVVGEIPGTDPKLKSQLVMLGGHLDSWQAATGATDNGAGCIVMMEAIRLLDSLGLKPKRTIRIALWGGEEQGLYGSFGYVKNHYREGEKIKPEQAKVSAYFNLDNGTGKIRGIYAQSNQAVKPIFEQWFKPFNDLGAQTVTLANTGSTDHLSFDWAGIPGFQFVQDPIDYETRTHHSNMDDYDHLQIDDLKQAAIIVASFVYQASIRPEMLPRKPLEKGGFVFDGF
ncbi:M20/M25/M40 family metallo-hydrolase [Mucilaginibacter celer]|uniref:Carboxypeptidase Q n=1 Tax=Mucilaginibacter celer TaxID=2305508 RepID=A0A494VT84_9SPHI|nr:M20/M25/M40 family metallo-hydrolase [Mucilaginibacter celer]AYL94563.1 M20/M25/M40 family metallo-hydrolase [Mucilaginibacter celer]